MKIDFHTVFGVAALALPFVFMAIMAFAVTIALDQNECIINHSMAALTADMYTAEELADPIIIGLVAFIHARALQTLESEDYGVDYVMELMHQDGNMSEEQLAAMILDCNL